MPSPHHGGAPLHANAPTPHEGHAASGRPGSRTTRYTSAPPPHGARQEPIHGASYLVSLATAVSHPAESLSAAPRASCPTGHSPRPPRQEPIRSTSRLVPHKPQPSAVPPGAYPRRLMPRVPDHLPSAAPPGAYPQRLVPCAPGHHTLPAYGCDLLHPNSAMAAGIASRHPTLTALCSHTDAT